MKQHQLRGLRSQLGGLSSSQNLHFTSDAHTVLLERLVVCVCLVVLTLCLCCCCRLCAHAHDRRPGPD